MKRHTDPFSPERKGGDGDNTDIRSRRPVWLTLAMLAGVLFLGYLIFGPRGDDDTTIVPIEQDRGSPLGEEFDVVP